MARLLSTISGCVCLHEPAPQLVLESSGYRYKSADLASLRQTLVQTRPPSVNGSVYTESNQTLALIIPVLAEVFPEARYIWLMRNGLDVVASAFSKQWYTRHSSKIVPYEDCNALQKAWIDGRIEGDRCGDVSAHEWNQMDRFSRCCWYWSYMNRIIEADLQIVAVNHSYAIRLETLDSDLQSLLKWMGLKAALLPAAKRHNTGVREPYHWSQWTPAERAAFEHWCGGLMDRFYPNWRAPDGHWQEIEYTYRPGLFARMASDYEFVQRVNTWLAPNRIG